MALNVSCISYIVYSSFYSSFTIVVYYIDLQAIHMKVYIILVSCEETEAALLNHAQGVIYKKSVYTKAVRMKVKLF